MDIDSGINLDTVRRMAGHESEKTTLHNYLFDRRDPLELQEAFTKALSVPVDLHF